MALHVGRSRLPELLKARHMSQAELARELELSESFISQIISCKDGSKTFSYLNAKKASEILKCKIDDLHEWEEY
jgi:transcriptional regulator with XRE-family HTH domain